MKTAEDRNMETDIHVAGDRLYSSQQERTFEAQYVK